MALSSATTDPLELSDAMARARAEWPELTVSDEVLRAWLLERAGDGTPLSRLRVGDLLLACACAQRDPAGRAASRRAFDASIASTLARARSQGTDPDDVRQHEEALAIWRGIGGMERNVALSIRGLADTARRSGDAADPLERAKVGLALAGALIDSGGDLARARELAEQARTHAGSVPEFAESARVAADAKALLAASER